MVRLPNALSDFLNFIRWIAAFLVVVGHLRSLIFVSYSAVESKTIFYKLFYFISSLGHEAVIVFFVMSGFLVGGKLWQEMKHHTFSWKTYLIKRVTRLYVVLIPALLIGGMIDYIGIHYFNDTGIYSNAFSLSSLHYDVTTHFSMEIFIANLLMLQESFFPTFGSNGPLWSLAYEFWYYILFPTILLIIVNIKNRVKMMIYSVMLVSMLFFLNFNILLYFSIWIVGVILFSFHKKLTSINVSIVLFAITLVMVKLNIFSPYLGDLTIALALGLMIHAFKTKEKPFVFHKFNHRFADFSFSLYLVHYPFILLIIATLLSIFNIGIQMQPGVYSFALFFSLLLASYLYAYLLYLLFEYNTVKVRNYLLRRLT